VGTLLTPAASTLGALALLAGAALGVESGDRHRWELQVDAGYVAANTPLGAWTEGGLGKLRYAEASDGFVSSRVLAAYHGRIAATWSATVVGDYLDDASSGIDIPEAFLEWRPIPTSRNQHQLRLGAFYPPLSLENVETGWQSPFTYSYSAINTWLGEEIRPVGAEWSLRRRLGYEGSPHELRAFASAFYGNDPAGTLLFWRGWSLHDRQSRLNDELPMPPRPVFDYSGAIVGHVPQSVEPFAETDHEPGYYGGVEWRYARRVLVQLAHYDNRADPGSFSDQQWGWGTDFTQAALQASLPWRLGLVAQRAHGSTRWISGARPDGLLSPVAELVRDDFDSGFVMLTRVFGANHRMALRYDRFETSRDEAPPELRSDDGDAWTLSYRYEHSARLQAGIEWLRIESRRDLWPLFYFAPERATETEVRAQLSYRLGSTAR
jgi:hypothetical protein